MDLGPRRWTGSPPVTRRGYGAAPGRCLQAAADLPCEMASESIADALQYLDDTIHRVYAAGRRSCAQGRWSVARAPVTWWTDCGRGPQTDAGERIISAHRAIEIREKRRRVLLSRLPGTGNDVCCRRAMRALPVIAERVSARSQGLLRG